MGALAAIVVATLSPQLYYHHLLSLSLSLSPFRCQPILSKLYLVWVIPSGNDFEVSNYYIWSTHYNYH